MKKIMTIIAILTVSSTVFAGSKDLNTMNTLLKAGASSEQFMSQIHLGLENVECSYSNMTKGYACEMNDISANDGEGAMLILKGEQAKSVYDILANAGASSDSGMGKSYISSKAIRCKQAVEGAADGSAAERTMCSVDVE